MSKIILIYAFDDCNKPSTAPTFVLNGVLDHLKEIIKKIYNFSNQDSHHKKLEK